ncbi:MAG TPA: hypothetical protein PLC72_18735 [Candidatus Hydrogenedentes bacterium]|nr:hypothetical protein [Candidatus Hydrogenedentota bacterium]
MAASAEQIARLRRMIAEPGTGTYGDAALKAAIERHPVYDPFGTPPTLADYSTAPPTVTENPGWMPTYDMNATAAELWEEKAAAVASDYSMTADGSSLRRDQVYEQYMKIAQRYRSKACPGTLELLSKTRRLDAETGGIVEHVNRYPQGEDDALQ